MLGLSLQKCLRVNWSLLPRGLGGLFSRMLSFQAWVSPFGVPGEMQPKPSSPGPNSLAHAHSTKLG